MYINLSLFAKMALNTIQGSYMGIVIAVLNQKGGVGKTTISANLATYLQNDGYSVLLVDTDAQGSLKDWSTATEDKTVSVYAVPKSEIKNEVPKLKDKFDVMILDGRPEASKETGIVIRLSDVVLIPVQASALDIWSTEVISDAIDARQELTDGIPIARFILNKVKKNTRLAVDAKEVIAQLNIPLMKNILHDREDYKKSMGQGKSIFHTKSDARSEFEALYKEFITEVMLDEHKTTEKA